MLNIQIKYLKSYRTQQREAQTAKDKGEDHEEQLDPSRLEKPSTRDKKPILLNSFAHFFVSQMTTTPDRGRKGKSSV